MPLYLDNAATSFPKPPCVLEAMMRYQTELGASPGRGGYAYAQTSSQMLDECRQRINTLIHGQSPEHVIFTLNASDALNLAIKGLVQPNEKKPPHVITTWMDHNSVLRPLNALVQTGGVTQTRVTCDPATGLVDPQAIAQAITPATRLIAVVHGSNVTGTLQPIAEIGKIAKAHNIPFLVDAAQTLGHYPVDVQADGIDLLAAPGHKGLFGPLGTGFLYIRPGLEEQMQTVREGGTGSKSELDVQPEFMPDRFEPGSHNAIGLIGLSAGVQWLMDQGIDTLWQHEQQLIQTMLKGLAPWLEQDSPLTLFGPPTLADRCGVFSIRIAGYDDPQQLSQCLEQDHNILTRSGIHCAPLAHQTLGTHTQGGTTRFSFSAFTTQADVQQACEAIATICERVVVKV